MEQEIWEIVSVCRQRDNGGWTCRDEVSELRAGRHVSLEHVDPDNIILELFDMCNIRRRITLRRKCGG